MIVLAAVALSKMTLIVDEGEGQALDIRDEVYTFADSYRRVTGGKLTEVSKKPHRTHTINPRSPGIKSSLQTSFSLA